MSAAGTKVEVTERKDTEAEPAQRRVQASEAALEALRDKLDAQVAANDSLQEQPSAEGAAQASENRANQRRLRTELTALETPTREVERQLGKKQRARAELEAELQLFRSQSNGTARCPQACG